MAADVMTKLIDANDVTSGNAVVYVDRSGNKQVLEPRLTNVDLPNPSGFSDRFDNRFDEPRYYTGDAEA